MASVQDWDYFNRNVQSGLLEGRFMNAAFTLIAAGPPRLSAVLAAATDVELGDIAYPIGVIQNFSISQNSSIVRLFEIGSERSYFIRGRTVGQVGLGRIMYHGPNLLRTLYAYLESNQGSNQFPALYQNTALPLLNTTPVEGGKQEYAIAPGFENLWVDLASDVFSQPIGLLVMFRDSNEDTVGAIYLEYGMVTNHGLSTESGSTVLSENAALLYERLVPIDVQAVALIRNSTDIQSIVGTNVVGSAA